MSNTYNPNYDYVSAHLAFVKKHSTFQPKHIRLINGISYHEMLTEWYKSYWDDMAVRPLNLVAYSNYMDDKKWLQEYYIIDQSILNNKPLVNTAFVTIGFNHQEFTPKKAIELIQSLLQLSYVKDGTKAVIENFRENGEHPHVHIKLCHDTKVYKSQIIQSITRLRHARLLILQRNFIDYKVFEEQHELYLQGIKKEAKLYLVEKDKIWRQQNNIPEVFEK